MGSGEEKRDMKKKNIALVIIILIIVIAFAGYFMFRPDVSSGSKAITIEVTGSDNSVETYELSTDAEYLKGAIDEIDGLSVEGEEGPYGIMVTKVNGELAEYETNGAYWAFYVNGDYCEYGIDTQPVNDGDDFGIVYTLAEEQSEGQ